MSENANQKEKYNKFINDIRKDKTINNLLLIFQDLKENKDKLINNEQISFQFSNDLGWFLINNVIDISTQVEIFKLYIDAFFNLKTEQEDLSKFKILEEIFRYDRTFYKLTSCTDNQYKFLKSYFEKYY